VLLDPFLLQLVEGLHDGTDDRREDDEEEKKKQEGRGTPSTRLAR
jgi:hypothetical protein